MSDILNPPEPARTTIGAFDMSENKEREDYTFCPDCHMAAVRMLEMHNVIVAQLSGKTGYCTECERLGRENKELREGNEALNKECEIYFHFGSAVSDIEKLLEPCLREIVRRIELCGASPDLTNAVSLASELHFAIVCKDKSAKQEAVNRLDIALSGGG
jgi:hypothetical protein